MNKTISKIIFLSIFYTSSFFGFNLIAQTDTMSRMQGDPIPGADVKLGTKPPGGKTFASAITNAQGIFEFKNLEAGEGYYLEIYLNDQGLKTSANPLLIEYISCGSTINTATNRLSTPPKVINKKFGAVEIIISTQDGIIRGIINVSRSNIKAKQEGAPKNQNKKSN